MVETLILLTLWLIACAVCAVIGFFVGWKGNKPIEVKKAPEQLTELQKLEIQKAKREVENFWSYTGDNQEIKNDGFNTKV